MSKIRTTSDYYVTVHLHRYHADNLDKTGERIAVIVGLPEEAAAMQRSLVGHPVNWPSHGIASPIAG
jgi:hypothetical protein